MKGTFFGSGGEECKVGWSLQRVEKREEDMLGIKVKVRDFWREHFWLRMKERSRAIGASKMQENRTSSSSFTLVLGRPHSP